MVEEDSRNRILEILGLKEKWELSKWIIAYSRVARCTRGHCTTDSNRIEACAMGSCGGATEDVCMESE